MQQGMQTRSWVSQALPGFLAMAMGLGMVLPAEADITPHAGMLRDPDISATHIAFRYADDLWLVAREGGVATPLVSPPGGEAFPRFSPDGTQLAFVASYDGDLEIYTLPVAGGVPVRVTHEPEWQVLCDWTPDGRLIYYTAGRNGLIGRTELFVVDAQGGCPERLPVPYGAEGAMSAGGRWLAYTPVMPFWVGPWKRYVGGSASDIWLMDLEQGAWRKVTDWEGSDVAPMWYGQTLYYLSDAGPANRRNLWSYDLIGGARRQLTRYEDYDVRTPAIGPGPAGGGEIVFTVGETLHRLDLATEEDHVVEVRIPGARPTLRPRVVDVADAVGHFSVAPGGKRVAVEARGDIWTVPAEHGSPRNLTRSSGVAERFPSWSPDGRWIAFFSDRSGEYELHVIQSDGRGEERQVTSGHRTFFYPATWSPNSERLVFQEKTGELWLCTLATGALERITADPWPGNTADERMRVSFSPDSRWVACDRSEPSDGSIMSIWLYDTERSRLHRVTSALADESHPTFGPDGDYLYCAARRVFEPTFSAVEFAWVYENTDVLMALPLRAEVERPFADRSDEVTWEDETPSDEEDAEGAANDADPDAPDGSPPVEIELDGPPPVEIELDGLQERAYRLPAAPGSFSALKVDADGRLIYLRRSGGADGEEPRVQLLDPTDPDAEEQLVTAGVGEMDLSPDGGTLAGRSDGGVPALYPAEAGAEAQTPVTGGMVARIDPREEWQQLYTDAWRLYRDFFYDEDMHGLDWPRIRERYAALLPDCASRADLTHVIQEMIGELNVSHARYGTPPDDDLPDDPGVGLLGVDFALENGAYRFVKIYRGPVWDPELRSPLAEPDVDVAEGTYLLAVNGVPVDTSADPWAPFVGLAGREVVLTVGPKPTQSNDARDVVVKAQDYGWERRLRYHAWVEANRRHVDQVSDGRIGYVHIANFHTSALNFLVEQFLPQQDRAALIVDQRFNGGGWTPHRFLEIFNRPPLMYRARRHGRDTPVPGDAHFGPKCMLMNELSGSSGDMFPWMFRYAGLGPLIGTRTWGGVVGLSGNPALIDGTRPNIPTAGTYTPEGKWIIEGWGVAPDLEVPDDPVALIEGTDVQLEAAIQAMKRALNEPHHTRPEPPPGPDRSGMGVPERER